MADVIDINVPYEILIRFGTDGKPRGAHAQFLRRVMLDGELLKEELGNAVPLDISDFPASDIIGQTATDALAELTRANAENSALAAALNEQANKLAEAEQQAAQALADREALSAEYRALQVQAQNIAAELNAAKQRIAALTPAEPAA